MNKLNYLLLDFKKEKLLEKKLNIVDLEIENIQKKTQLHLNVLNVGLLNTRFSLTEIFKST
ncbi:hypothetical protein H9I45_12625 [Polaribacter haliotis]|uniref:Uncharacterized protein n=1 Tax=Polaribacter haliotis TaxID=1888915 RepID=A0A7L8AEA8_9FLAO|nr:hypothetical protein [Polaribacter haliotis]QOD60179.1 hypothetical protein H9I45_12625 [Polaribacter haliotis]